MKKLYKITALCLFVLSILASAGCEKMNMSEEELLRDHIWKWVEMTTTSTNENVQSIIALYNILMTGATLQFHADGTYTISMLDETDDGDWELINNNEVLLMDDDEMAIIKLTKDELVLQGEEVSNDYGTYSVTMYWEK